MEHLLYLDFLANDLLVWENYEKSIEIDKSHKDFHHSLKNYYEKPRCFFFCSMGNQGRDGSWNGYALATIRWYKDEDKDNE